MTPRVPRPAGFGLAFALLILVLAAAAFGAETVIRDSDAAGHVGERVTVKGFVASVFTSRAGNTFLNFGKPYPNQTFAAVIFRGSAKQFGNPAQWEGRHVLVTGKVKLYKGKPEIILTSVNQLRSAE